MSTIFEGIEYLLRTYRDDSYFVILDLNARIKS